MLLIASMTTNKIVIGSTKPPSRLWDAPSRCIQEAAGRLPSGIAEVNIRIKQFILTTLGDADQDANTVHGGL